MNCNSLQKGYLLVLILIFGAIFMTIISGFLGFVVTQYKAQVFGYNKERALNIAEAGLNYYKWYLSHYPNDTTNGTGLPGPYVGVYSDPEGAPMGTYSLTVGSSTACGEMYAIDIISTGNTYDAPDAGRTVYARYAQPTVAEYAYIINSNVWAGADRTIIGPYHSNGGVRMDGTNNSTVTSGQNSWSCNASYGCSPTATKNGVFGTGPNSDLWSFPSPPINFTGLTVDLASMEDKAKNHGGLYIGPSGKSGYHLIFQSNGTVKVYTVKTTTSYQGYSVENNWQTEKNVISTQTLVGTYTVPTACSVIYVEDKVWLEGVVKGKVTLAAADVDTSGVDPDIILNDNIIYANSGSGLFAIAENNILVGLAVPNDMTLNGIFAAQNGHFGRNHYESGGLPSSLDGYVKRNSLTINGSIVSNGSVGTKWVSGATYTSGFNTRYNSYDRSLVSDPPPLTPNVSDTYKFIEWREEN